ncbi:MAG: alpha/beta fold hydrolase [Pseudomonadota bacterium]
MPISQPFSKAEDHYDAVIVGSGYGGGVAASRLARVRGPGAPKVAVLERGREIAPGKYPDNPLAAGKEMQVTLADDGRTIGKAQGLYDVRMGPNVNVLLGCGLGGTSLINANVAIEPDPRIYARWPEPFRKDRELLAPYYERARAMLGSKPYPAGKTPPKLAALEKVAKGTGMEFGRPDINVSFEDGFNAVGVWQNACTDCGDCVSGCNYGAKNTVLMNYLPDAAAHGAHIFTGAEVMMLARDGEDWVIAAKDLSPQETREAGSPYRLITADIVVLAAGTLGSTEILLRSDGRFDRLDPSFAPRDSLRARLSVELGKRFSGNGDVWSFGYNANIPAGPEGDHRAPVYGVGAGTHKVSHGPTPPGGAPYKPGPCITGMATITDPIDVTKSVLVEEGVMPGALAPVYAAAFPALAAMHGDPFRFGDVKLRLEDVRTLGEAFEKDPFLFAETVYDGPVSRTLPFLVMSHDASDGELRLNADRVTVHWPQAGADAALVADEQVIKRACDAIEAEYLPNPLWQDAFGRRVVTVHPLGGCGMADRVEDGVVDHRCAVFDTEGGVHEGLYVCDGAVMPRAVGVNPHLAITAVAERAVEILAGERGWTIDFEPGKPRDETIPVEDIKEIALEVLRDAIAGLDQLDAAIAARAWELATMLLKGLWRTLTDDLPEMKGITVPDADAVAAALGNEEGMTKLVGPVVDQVLGILKPIETALTEGRALDAWEVAEKALGDFSPPVHFHEAMVGHITTKGLSDPEGAFDPHAAAGAGPDDCRFEADISADAVGTAITPPEGSGKISNATLVSETFGSFKMKQGTFRFLMPDPERIECWEMIYEGPLEEIGGAGRSLWFEGRKRLQYREGSHWWTDLTELAVDLRAAEGSDEVVARGQLRVTLQEVLRQADGLSIDYTKRNLQCAALKAYVYLKTAWGKGLPQTAAAFRNEKFRANAVKAALLGLDPEDLYAAKAVALGYKAKVFARMGGLVLRAYGGVFSYLQNFPGKTAETPPPFDRKLPKPEVFRPEVEPGVYLKLTRFPARGQKGPVVLAGGFGTRASSLALSTAPSIAAALWEDGYDVWLFDYRGSGEIEASLAPFTLDDVALKDWPAAIDLILERTGAKAVCTVVHCIGSMSLFMAILGGETRVKSMVVSQLGTHAITNWFNFAKGDARTAEYIAHGVPQAYWGALDALGLPPEAIKVAKTGLSVVDPRSPSGAALADEPGAKDLDAVIDAMLWKVPSFAPVPCLSPTCHRINMIFGPSYRHEQLNAKTHDAIQHMFGPVSTHPFIHIAQIFGAGHVVSADGRFNYMEHVDRLRLPIHFIAGGRNQEMLPEASLRTLDWLRDAHSGFAQNYTRSVFPEFGHMDCFIGEHAHKDIFPDIIHALNQHE